MLLKKTHNRLTPKRCVRLFIMAIICSLCTYFYYLTGNVSFFTELKKSPNNTNGEDEKFDARNSMQCMHSSQIKSNIPSHWGAPIHSLPKDDYLILPISATTSICDPEIKRLRVIFFLSTFSHFENRKSIRATWGNFENNSQNLTRGNWTKFFLVAEPSDNDDMIKLKNESEVFGDIVVAKVPEAYYKTTLKILVGLKFVACFCSTAEYMIKSDDDIYVRLDYVDEIIEREQKKLDKLKKPALSGEKSKLYMGFCEEYGPIRPPKKGPWVVSFEEYNETTPTPMCFGLFLILSMSAVVPMSQDCPHTCIGLDPSNFTANQRKPCFWKFEDVFMGSCIGLTQKQTTTIDIRQHYFKNEHHLERVKYNEKWQKAYVLHGFKKAQTFLDYHAFLKDKQKENSTKLLPHNKE